MRTHIRTHQTHWLLLSFVGLFVIMGSMAWSDSSQHYAKLQAHEIQLQTAPDLADSDIPSLAVKGQDIGNRYAIPVDKEPPPERHSDQLYDSVETAYEQVVRANRKVVRLFTRTLRQISTKWMGMPSGMWGR